MQQRLTLDELVSMQGKPVYSTDGDKVGTIDRVFYDTQSGEPEWVGVDTGGLFSSKHVLVPVQGARVQSQDEPGLVVPYSKDQVKDAPEIDSDEISEEREQEVYAYYGLRASDYRSETQLPEDRVAGGPAVGDVGHTSQTPAAGTTAESMSVHEEQLNVGKRDVQRSVRLRKWVESQPVSEQVNLRREEAYVEREPVDRPAPGAQIGEQEIETTLHEEEPVVRKETVERERVRLAREEHEEQQTVQGEVRREHVEAEGELDEDEDRGDELRRAS